MRHLKAREVGTWDWVTNGCQDRVLRLRLRLVWCFFATLHKIKHMVQRISYGTGFSVPQLYPAILSIFFVLSTHHFHTYTHTSTRIIIEYSFSSWPGLWLGTGFVLSMRHWNLCCSNMSLVGCRMFFLVVRLALVQAQWTSQHRKSQEAYGTNHSFLLFVHRETGLEKKNIQKKHIGITACHLGPAPHT